MDYTYQTYTTPTDAASGGFLAGIGLGLILVYLVFLVLSLVVAWKIYTKAGKPGWAAIVPIYNVLVMLEIVGRPMWWIALLLIPVANIVVCIILINDLAKSFGKDVGWTLGLIFLSFIFYPTLAFGSSKYVGPAAAGK